jgi:hypothetical protein
MDQNTDELLKIILDVYARQMALLELVRDLGVSESQISGALEKAKARLRRVPRLAAPPNQRPSTLQGLAGLLESIRWPES